MVKAYFTILCTCKAWQMGLGAFERQYMQETMITHRTHFSLPHSIICKYRNRSFESTAEKNVIEVMHSPQDKTKQAFWR